MSRSVAQRHAGAVPFARESADLRQALVEKNHALEEKDRLIADLQRRLARP